MFHESSPQLDVLNRRQHPDLIEPQATPWSNKWCISYLYYLVSRVCIPVINYFYTWLYDCIIARAHIRARVCVRMYMHVFQYNRMEMWRNASSQCICLFHADPLWMCNTLLERSIAVIYSGQRLRQTFKTSYAMEIHIALYRIFKRWTLIYKNENGYGGLLE